MIFLSVERNKSYLRLKEPEAEIRPCKSWRFPVDLLSCFVLKNFKMDLEVLRVKVGLRKLGGRSRTDFSFISRITVMKELCKITPKVIQIFLNWRKSSIYL